MNLSSRISGLPSVGKYYEKRLEKLGIYTAEDLLYHVPSKYKDLSIVSEIASVQPGETVTVRGILAEIKNVYTKFGKKIQIAVIADNTAKIQIIWFNQPYLVKYFTEGETYSFSGKISEFNGKKSIVSPDYEIVKKESDMIHTGRLVPTYPETSGISSKWLRNKIHLAFHVLKKDIKEFLPEDSLKKLNMVTFPLALEYVHYPKDWNQIASGKERLAFNELLFHQIKSLHRKRDWSKNKVSHILSVDKSLIDQFTESLDFKLTPSQLRSINEIFEDLKKESPMNRLLEGDVGSGKTVVAAAAAFASFANGYQTVVMAPTQILAQQHFETLNKLFSNFKVRVSLITSSEVKSDLGKTDIFVGTHALIHKKIKFDSVALVVIDEQHRFGVEQRSHLVQKSKKGRYAPNVLTMTATPIPRTIALTVYGDLDLSTLQELPKGRKPVTTWIVPPQKRDGAYGWIKEQITKNETQVFFICPLIEESQVETMKQVKAVKKEYEELETIFSDLRLGILHGRQKAGEKQKVLEKFRKGELDILVSTPVVEVGVDIPNATIMVIEAGERYGLAQLHQLRGRVGRGEEKSYCLVFTENRSPKVRTRLDALTKSISGFELAELDLRLRGPGEIFGVRQHGFPELKIAEWSDTELIKKSRNFAEEIIQAPEKYPKLLEKLNPEENLNN